MRIERECEFLHECSHVKVCVCVCACVRVRDISVSCRDIDQWRRGVSAADEEVQSDERSWFMHSPAAVESFPPRITDPMTANEAQDRRRLKRGRAFAG